MRALLLDALFSPLFLAKPAIAALDFEDAAFPELVTSSRALAMGNAYLCKVDDAWSAFYNPAGLGTVRKPQLHLFNLHVEASSGLLDAIGDGTAIEMPGKYVKTFDPDEMRTVLAENQGKLAHSRFNLFPNFTIRGLTLGYLYSQRNRAIINDDAANQFEIAERKDHGPVMALNASFLGGIFKVGASAVYLTRAQLYKSFGPSAPVTITDADKRFGKSLQLTAGAKLTLPAEFLPTFSVVLRNATDSDFGHAEKGGVPDSIPQTIDVGFSITPQISKSSRVHMEVNLRDLGDEYDTDATRRAGLGVELDFNRRIFLRAGYGDGWGSGGLGLRSRTFALDLTTYAIDRSLEGLREEEDRRWVFSLSSGF